MAFEEGIKLVSATTGADLSASSAQFTLVKLDANGNVVQCAALSDLPVGVLYDTASSGRVVPVAINGIVKVRAGATITPGQELATTASGTVQPAAAASSQAVIGVARTGAVSGDIFSVLLDTTAPYIKP